MLGLWDGTSGLAVNDYFWDNLSTRVLAVNE